MGTYILKRLLLLPPVLIGVSLIAFLCMEAIPGDLADHLAGKHQDAATKARLRKEFGLDQPLPVRYLKFLEQVVVHGNLGFNRETGRPVSREIGEHFAATVELALAAMLVAAFLGVQLGVAAGRRPGSATSAGALAIAYGGISIPIFWLAILVTGVLAGALGWFPAVGRMGAGPAYAFELHTGLYLVDSLLAGNLRAWLSALHHLVLPAMVLATIPMAIIVRLTRASMIEELSREYVRTARAKGLSEKAVVRRHALRNAAIPIVTTTGAQFGYLLSGAVLTEFVFSWGGLGTYVVQAALSSNTPALIAGILLMAMIFVFVNLATDLTYAVIDPRVRTGTAGGRHG